VEPAVAVALGVVLLGESLGVVQVLGVAVVLTSVAVLLRLAPGTDRHVASLEP
jgi:drug/metabolite transporter (DMT)-like permease